MIPGVENTLTAIAGLDHPTTEAGSGVAMSRR